jgi:hypothetical protein
LNRVLLLGAGFSRNWGGWLANEATEYLLGSAHLDATHRKLLLDCRQKGGFEAALGTLQQQYKTTASDADKERLRSFRAALESMLEDMNDGLGAHGYFESRSGPEMPLRRCLAHFDAIFTLNYDVFLETHYFNKSIAFVNREKWDGWQLPGLKPWTSDYKVYGGAHVPWLIHDSDSHILHPRQQPYIKLHGSANWRDDTDGRMMIAGINKGLLIGDQPLLSWYQELFIDYLSKPKSRLMVIGYSFSDVHINDRIIAAAAAGQLELFIIDPQGLDVLDKGASDKLLTTLGPVTRGISRRSLGETFGRDRVEHEKLWKFLR